MNTEFWFDVLIFAPIHTLDYTALTVRTKKRLLPMKTDSTKFLVIAVPFRK